MPGSLLIAEFVPMAAVVKRVGTIWPVHFGHTVFAFEEVWQRQRTKIQAIGCLWMAPNQNRPFAVENRYMLGFDRQRTLRATQASWSEIDPASRWLRGRRRQVGNCDLRGTSGVDGD